MKPKTKSKSQVPLPDPTPAPTRPFEHQTELERALRAHLWFPADLLRRSERNLKHHLRAKDYRSAAEAQESIRDAERRIAMWETLLHLYELERQTPGPAAFLTSPHPPRPDTL